MQKFRRNPYAKIPDVMARRCEKFFGKRRGWIDESIEDTGSRNYLDPDMQDLLALYARLSPRDRKKFFAIGEVMVG